MPSNLWSGDNFQLSPGIEKAALSAALRSGRAATLWPPQHSPRATRAALCRERGAGAPARGGEASLPTPGALGLGQQTPAVYTGREGGSAGREPGGARRSEARTPPSLRGAPGAAPHPRAPPAATASGAPGRTGGAAYLRGAARARRARADRRRGSRAPAAWCAPLGRGARRGRSGAEAGDRSRMPGAALGLTAPADGPARAPPPPSPSQAGRDTWSGRRSGRSLAEPPCPAPSAAGPHSPPPLSPPPSPAGRHSVSLRLGGTGRGESGDQLRPAPGPARTPRPPGAQVLSGPTHCRVWGGSPSPELLVRDSHPSS